MLLIFRFLRGGSESEVLNLEDDSLQEHEHSLTDPGHKPFMIDPGHSHEYKGKLFEVYCRQKVTLQLFLQELN